MTIEYDIVLKKWVVWLHKQSLRIEIFEGKKRECEAFVKRKKRKRI